MSAIGQALKSRAVVGGLFLEVMLDSGPVRAFSGIGSYTDPAGRVWTGVGGLGRMSPVQTSEGVSASAFTVGFDVSRGAATETAFADIGSTIIADSKTPVQGRRVRGYIGLFHKETGELIGGALRQWVSGVGSHINLSWSRERIALTLHCEPLIGSVWPAKGRYLTHEDQQLLHPGDFGLQYITIIANGGRNVTWNPGA